MQVFRLIILTGALLGCSFLVKGQDLRHAAGLRWAYGSGVSYRYMITERHATEFLLTSRWGGAAAASIFQWHRQVGQSPNWIWYYGAGVHVGMHRRSNQRPFENLRLGETHVNVGMELIVAIGYRFQQIPLEFTLDLKPSISFSTEEPLPETFGLTGRWLF